MRSASLGFAILSLVALATPLRAAAEQGAEIVDGAWLRAMQANDLEGALRVYADDAVVWLPDTAERRGTAAIRAAYHDLLGANTVTAVSLSETGYRTLGKVSVGWGRFSLTLAPKDGGAATTLSGRFTAVAERRGDRWVYVVDHASAEPPPAPSAPPAPPTEPGG